MYNSEATRLKKGRREKNAGRYTNAHVYYSINLPKILPVKLKEKHNTAC